MSGRGLDALPCLTEHDGHCITCSDEGVPMTVIALDGGSGLATCEDGAGARCTIDLGLLDDVALGTVLLTHAGTAIAMLTGDGRSGVLA